MEDPISIFAKELPSADESNNTDISANMVSSESVEPSSLSGGVLERLS